MFTEQKLPIPLSEERKAELSDRNTTIDLHLIVQKEKLDEAKAEFKANTESQKDEKKQNLQLMRQGYEMLLVKVFENVNEQEGTMEYTDEEGVKVYERPLSMSERSQYRIKFGRRQIKED